MQLFRSQHLGLRLLQARPRRRHGGFTPFQFRIIGSRVDFKEQCPRFDFSTRLVMDLIQIPADAGSNLHGFDRIGSPSELGKVGQLLFQRLCHDHRRVFTRGRGGHTLLLTAHAGHEEPADAGELD